jgi:hypothetical protein
VAMKEPDWLLSQYVTYQPPKGKVGEGYRREGAGLPIEVEQFLLIEDKKQWEATKLRMRSTSVCVHALSHNILKGPGLSINLSFMFRKQ